MTTELFIENQRTDISSTLSSLLTLNIDDIKDFSSRQTSFSKTIILPGSANNNKILGSIFEVAVRNDYNPVLPNAGINFNASASATCVLFQDFLQTFQGTLRILQINIDRGKIEYEVAIAGILSTLNVRLSSGLLEDLDFSAYDHTYNETSIVNSWNNPGGSGYYYPLIDYGAYSPLKHDWDYHTFRPALYVKEYIDKMFAAADFRYVSSFFNTPYFKTLVIPHNQKVLTSASSTLYTASNSVPQSDTATPLNVFFDTLTGSGFTTTDNINFTYAGSVTSSITFSWNFTGTWYSPAFLVTLLLYLFKNGTFYQVGGTGTLGAFNFTGNITLTVAPGDVIKFEFGAFRTITVDTASWKATASGGVIRLPANLGDAISMADAIPKNIRQVDFLTSLCKMFNLYITEDKFDNRLLYITPYIDFYTGQSQNAVDWTYKLDHKIPASIKPMSEINAKIYNFKYKDDSDYYNELYKKRYNQTYGSYLYDTEFEFVSQVQDINLIFAGIPLVGYAEEDKVYSTIFKLNGNVEENIDSVIRILQTKKISGVTGWDILDGAAVLTTLTDYGYAGHLDDPDSPANDIGFGVPAELFFILVSGDLSANLFNVYWSEYMSEITDKDSKLLSGKFYLTPQDILNLDFSKYVNVEGNLFRLNKIIDYNLTKPDTCAVELLKVITPVFNVITVGGAINGWTVNVTTVAANYVANITIKSPLNLRIDWGDGTIITYTDATLTNIAHTYVTAGNYVIGVGGTFLTDGHISFTPLGTVLKATSVINTTLADLSYVFDGTGLTGIPAGLFNSAPNITDVSFAFRNCTAITSIPSGLFSNCPAITTFESTFEGCTSITTIPAGLFDNNTEALTFKNTFLSVGVTRVTGADPRALPAGLFDNCRKVTNFQGTFQGSKFIAIPSGLFAFNTEVTTFESTFQDCTLIASAIPATLFAACTKVTTFESTFQGCTKIFTIPAGLFINNTKVTTFKNTFTSCDINAAIPSGLFSNCPLVTTFERTFTSNRRLPSIPAGLFDGCPLVTSFSQTFITCTALTTIPGGLFNFNTEVLTFAQCFQSAGITAIPSGLFNNCTKVTTFFQTFRAAKITAIPAGLFNNNTAVTTFESCFEVITTLTTLPAGLFANCNKVTNHSSIFFNSTNLVGPLETTIFNLTAPVTTFANMFNGCANLTGTAPTLWVTYPSTLHAQAFRPCTLLTNYASIPAGWK